MRFFQRRINWYYVILAALTLTIILVMSAAKKWGVWLW